MNTRHLLRLLSGGNERAITVQSQPIEILPMGMDRRREIGSSIFQSTPITDPAFRTHDVLCTALGRSNEVAALPKGTHYGCKHALSRVQTTAGTRHIGYGHGTREWCLNWPALNVENHEGRFAVVIDLKRQVLASYKYASTPPRQRVLVTETVQRRRTFWR